MSNVQKGYTMSQLIEEECGSPISFFFVLVARSFGSGLGLSHTPFGIGLSLLVPLPTLLDLSSLSMVQEPLTCHTHTHPSSRFAPYPVQNLAYPKFQSNQNTIYTLLRLVSRSHTPTKTSP